jgi:LuxR family transcriptional regulator, maltose regulon positive regulatory protein
MNNCWERRVRTPVARTRVLGPEPLSAREDQVLQYLPTHLRADQIGARLFVSRHTIKTHVKAIYRKLGVSNRDEAVTVARTFGLL